MKCHRYEPRPDGRGYMRRWAPGHPQAGSSGMAYEHRYVLHEAGVEIPPGSHVHHINGDGTDNRLENLAVLTATEHGLRHAVERGTMSNAYGVFPVIRDPEARRARQAAATRRWRERHAMQ